MLIAKTSDRRRELALRRVWQNNKMRSKLRLNDRVNRDLEKIYCLRRVTIADDL